MTVLAYREIELTTPSGAATYRAELTITLLRRDFVSNQSTIAREWRIRKLAKTGRWSAEANYWWVKRDGVIVADGNLQYNFDTVPHDGVPAMGPWILISAGTLVVDHEADGSAQVRVEAFWDDTAANLAEHYFDVTVDLPGIARASKVSVSPSPQIAGVPVTVALDRANPAFTHDLTWESGALSGSIGTGIATSASFTPSADVLDEFPTLMQAPVTITAVTKNGATVVGTSQTTLMVKAAPAPPVIGGQQFAYDLRARRVALVDDVWTVLSGEIHASRMTFADVGSGTSTLKLEWSELADVTIDELDVVAVDVHDGIEWVHVERFVMMRDENDDANEARMHTYTGISYVDFVLGRGRVQPVLGAAGDARGWHGVTPGSVFNQLLTEGKARGWGSQMGISFTAATASDGAPWRDVVMSMSEPLDKPYLQVLQGLVDAGQAEYRTAYRDGQAFLELLNPGSGSDWATAGADPIVNLALARPSRAPRRATNESIITRMTGSGEGDLRRTIERPVPAELEQFGHLEGAIAAGDVKTAADLDRLIEAGLDDASKPVEERTFLYSVSAAPRHLWPLYTYRAGDWVLIPGDDAPVRARVAQITLTKDEDGSIDASVVVGDRIVSGIAGIARRQSMAAGGTIPGGSGRAPQRLDGSIPAAPVLEPLTSAGYWDSDGAAKAAVTVSWSPVTTALDGSNISVAQYEVWTRPTALDQWGMYTQTSSLEYVIPRRDVNAPLDVRVRAMSATGVGGAWSDFEQIVTAEPAPPTVPPSAPTPTADAVGTLTIPWDGLIGATLPPPQFAYLLAEISVTEDGAYSPAGQQLLAAGATTVANVGVGDFWVRLRWFDRLGHPSAPSTAVMVTVAALPFDDREPAAPTGLIVTSDAQWTSTAPTARLLGEWDAVTVDVDGEPIDVVLYEMWGRIDGEPAPRLLTATKTLDAIHAPVDLGSDWLLSVRAQSSTLVWGPFSAEVPVTAAEPTFDLSAPVAPVATSSRGVIHVTSDGVLEGPIPAPSWVTHFLVETSVDDVDADFAIAGAMPAGSWRVTLSGDSYAVGSESWVRLRAVDRLGRASAASSAVPVLVVGIAGPDLEANSVSTNHIVAGSLQVDHVSPTFGRDLAIDGNVTITATAERIDTVEADAAATAAGLAAQQLAFQVTPDEVRIQRPGSPFVTAIDDERLEFRESGVARAWLSAGQWNAESIVTPQMVMGPKVIEHDGSSLIFRRT